MTKQTRVDLEGKVYIGTVHEVFRADVRPDGSLTKLTVTSPTFREGQAIPPAHSAYDHNASPALNWSDAPTATASYAILLEDPDAKITPLPVVHWVVWNIPGKLRELREGLQTMERLSDPDGLRRGPNAMGAIGYKGPRPPKGDPPHRYHFQVFALDRMLDLPAGTTRDELIQAMKGHVLASGELTGTFQNPSGRPSLSRTLASTSICGPSPTRRSRVGGACGRCVGRSVCGGG